MTVTYYPTDGLPIGAYELKRSYQKNMRTAVLLVLGAFAIAIAVAALVQALTPVVAPKTKDLVVIDPTIIGPPQSVVDKPVQIVVSQPIAKPVFTLPEAEMDELVTEDYVVVSQDSLAALTPSIIGDVVEPGNAFREIPHGWDLPETTAVFVAFDEDPVILSQPQPKYPELARHAGIEGVVRVEVLVDRYGDVKSARVIKESGTNVGFEEAALEAARLTKWRPAMQNHEPVKLWVAFNIAFRLK